MNRRHIMSGLVGAILFGSSVTAGYFHRDKWLPWLMPSSAPSRDHEHDGEAHGPVVECQQVKLSAQAQANLRLEVKPLKADTFWRTIQVPGTVVDRPAHSDRGVVAPVTAVVTKVHAFPGDMVRVGEPLFTLRLLSEATHLAQSELFKATKEIQIVEEKRKRLSDPALAGAIPANNLIEVENQLRRLAVAVQAYRTELLTRGLKPAQINAIAEGKFVLEIQVVVPERSRNIRLAEFPTSLPAVGAGEAAPLAFEVQELKVELGQQVQAGQTLGLLSNHQSLYIEGRAFRQETPLLEKAAREGWPVHVEFMEEPDCGWPSLEQVFTIRHIANTIDPASRTFAFFLPLNNQCRCFEKEGKPLMLWRFRPGQKVRLHVRVEKFENVFVLPADAVVREGPEAYVFRQNGDLFDRKPVRVVHQDRRYILVANDGSIPPGLFVAQNGATQINRVLKSGSGGLPPGFHMHADGSIHANSDHK